MGVVTIPHRDEFSLQPVPPWKYTRKGVTHLKKIGLIDWVNRRKGKDKKLPCQMASGAIRSDILWVVLPAWF